MADLMDMDPGNILMMASKASPTEETGDADNSGAQTTETEELAGSVEVENVEADDDASTTDDDDTADNGDVEEVGDDSDDDDPEAADGDQDPEAEGSSYLVHDEDEGREVFLKAVDPVTGEKSVYLDRDSAQQGVQRQLEYIGELKRQVTEARDGMNAESLRLKDEISIYRHSMTPEQAREALVLSKLPEGLRDVDPTTLTEDEDLKAYKTARIDAEITVEREIRQYNETQKEAATTGRNAATAAENHVRSRVDDIAFFGLTNPEDRFTILKKVNEKPEGSESTYREIADGIAKDFGTDASDRYLKGLSLTFATSKAEEKKTERKKVATIVKKVVQRPVKQAVKADKPRLVSDNPRSILEAAVALQQTRRK